MTRDIDIAILAVRLSVYPSVRYVPVLYGNGLPKLSSGTSFNDLD